MAAKKRIKHSNLLLKVAADFFMPFALVMGISVVLHGHLTPGGGFQGGVLISSCALLIYLGYGWSVTEKSASWRGYPLCPQQWYGHDSASR